MFNIFLARAQLALWFKTKHKNLTFSVESLMSDHSVADMLSLIGKVAFVCFSLESSSFGLLKLNVDGAMLRNDRLGASVVFLEIARVGVLLLFSETVGLGTPV
ncbi:hypothetical protein GQ457_01G050390 [Hibiscus cannabinus]